MKKLIWGIVIILASCHNKEVRDVDVADKVFDISFKNNHIAQQLVELSSIADSIGYIELKTDTNNLMGEISDIEFINNNFYIWDRLTSSIFIFNKEGECVSKINKKGQGPGEYVEINAFDVNAKDGSVHIFDGMQKKMLIYSKQGEFIRDFTTEDFVYDFAVFPNGNYVFYAPLENSIGNHRRGLWRVNSEGQFVKHLVEISPDFKYGGLYPKYFCRINDSLVGLMGGEDKDNIYHISQNKFKTKYHLNIDIDIPEELRSKSIINFEENSGKVYTKNSYFESDNYLMFSINNFKTQIFPLYNKRTDSLVQPSDILNNIDDVPLGRSVGFSNNTWILYHTEFNGEIEGKEVRVSSERNPLLQILYLKK